MRINRLRVLLIIICSAVIALWSEAQCSDLKDDIPDDQKINYVCNGVKDSFARMARQRLDIEDKIDTFEDFIPDGTKEELDSIINLTNTFSHEVCDTVTLFEAMGLIVYEKLEEFSSDDTIKELLESFMCGEFDMFEKYPYMYMGKTEESDDE